MNSERLAYPIQSVKMEFDCLPQMHQIFVMASSQHFGVLVPLKNLPEVTEIQKENDSHAGLFKNVVDEFEELVKNYANAAKKFHFPLPLPEYEQGHYEFFGAFVELSEGTSFAQETMGHTEYMDMEGRYLFIAIDGTTLDEFIGENNNSVGSVLH